MSVPQACMTSTDPLVVRKIDTPLGPMVAAASRAGLSLLEFGDRPALEREVQELARTMSRPFVPEGEGLGASASAYGVEHLDLVERELREYFAGHLRDFTVGLYLPGSPFERSVWTALQRIPFGETTSYSRLAFRLGSPGAARAVGRANGRNRVAIVVPCHRVIHEDGTLCGYGGGLWRKEKLLELERMNAGQGSLFAA